MFDVWTENTQRLLQTQCINIPINSDSICINIAPLNLPQKAQRARTNRNTCKV